MFLMLPVEAGLLVHLDMTEQSKLCDLWKNSLGGRECPLVYFIEVLLPGARVIKATDYFPTTVTDAVKWAMSRMSSE